MSFLSLMEAKLPPGFRFHPRDEELVIDYLAKRITGDQSNGRPMILDVDLNKVEPWELPAYACVGKEWYFYSQRDKKYATGHRTNRATRTGYWKATGKDRQVADGRNGGKMVGMRKTLVFYQGRAPKGRKTDWVLHEFRMEGSPADGHARPPPSSSSSSSPASQEDLVLCRVFRKSRSLYPKHDDSAENCYDDMGSSSLPPLTDTYINFEQQPHPSLNSSCSSSNVNMHGFHEQVPCFSTALRQPPPPRLADMSLLPNGTSPAASAGTLPDVGSFLDPVGIRAVLDQMISKAEGDGLRLTAERSVGFPPAGGAHSTWNPF